MYFNYRSFVRSSYCLNVSTISYRLLLSILYHYVYFLTSNYSLQSDSEDNRHYCRAHCRPKCPTGDHHATRITRSSTARVCTISCWARPRRREACVCGRLSKVLHCNPGRGNSVCQIRISRELANVEAHPVVCQIVVHGGYAKVAWLCHQDERVAVRDIADRRRGLKVRDGIIRGDHKRRSCCVGRNGHGACHICGNPVDELDARVVTGYVEVDHEEDASAGALLVGEPYWGRDCRGLCGFW
jgi:hypothetical protein